MMQTRLATLEDIEAIRRIGLICWPETYTAIAPPGYVEDGLQRWWSAEFLRDAITAAENWVWVAEEEDEIVGTTHFALLEPTRAVMWKFYVLPDWRNQGVGRRLFESASAHLPATVHTVMTEYLATNQRAAAVYVSLGFAFSHDEHADAGERPLTYTWVTRKR